MNDAMLQIIIKARDLASQDIKGAKKELQALEKEQERYNKGLWKVGLTTAKYAIGAIGGMTIGLAAAEQSYKGHIGSVNQMRVSLRNLGMNYDDVKNSLEAWIASQEWKTGVADEAQRSSMSSLVTLTGDYTTAMQYQAEINDLVSRGIMTQADAMKLFTAYFKGDMETVQAMIGTTDLAGWLKNVKDNTEVTITATDRLKIAWGNFVEALGDTHVLDGAINMLTTLMGNIANLDEYWHKVWQTFQEPFVMAWRGIVAAAGYSWQWLVRIFNLIVKSFSDFLGPIKEGVGKIATAIATPFVGAFKFVVESLNGVLDFVRKFNWSFGGFSVMGHTIIPGFDFNPFIGIPGITVPDFKVPSFYSGGMVPGPVGSPQLVVAHGGETFSGVGRGNELPINIYIGQTKIEELIIDTLTRRARAQGAFR